jgi:hypothetical protein
VYYPINCISVLQLLGLDNIKCFKQYYIENLVQKAVCCKDSVKDVELKISVLQAIHFIVAAWQQVMHFATANCFRHCGYGHEQKLTQTVLKERIMHSKSTGFGVELRRM